MKFQYLEASEARHLPGLRLALSAHVPGPWGQAAQHVFDFKGIPFVPVAQRPGEPNDDLRDWTGFRNAPVAAWNDEPAKSSWSDIITLAERIQPEPAIMPPGGVERVLAWGLVAEMAAETGFGWTRRLMMMRGRTEEGRPSKVNPEVMHNAYGGNVPLRDRASERAAEILRMLAAQLHAQRLRGSAYFVGDQVSAPDLYWAAFSILLEPLPHDVNPMPRSVRASYGTLDATTEAAKDPILLAHRDMMFSRHLTLPLSF